MLAVRERGSGPPLVLLHGVGSSARCWGDLLPLADYYRVLAPDLLGFGRSPQPRGATYSPDEHLAAVHATLAARAGGPFALIGHSMGSVLALHYAARFPADVRCLVLIALPLLGATPWGHSGSGLLPRWHHIEAHTRVGSAIMAAAMRLARPLWARVGPRLRPDAPPDAVRDALAGSYLAYWRTLESVVYGSDVPALLRQVRAPITLIHGAEDGTAPIAPVRALADSARLPLIVIAGAAHNPYFTHHDATVRAIEQALRRCDGAEEARTSRLSVT